MQGPVLFHFPQSLIDAVRARAASGDHHMRQLEADLYRRAPKRASPLPCPCAFGATHSADGIRTCKGSRRQPDKPPRCLQGGALARALLDKTLASPVVDSRRLCRHEGID